MLRDKLLTIDFDRTIETTLSDRELWRLLKEAFEDPSTSPIWPVDLEETQPTELREGAPITATYKLGPFRASPHYYITDLQRGRSFSYESQSSHPLAGGATVEVLPRPGGSALRWRGSYRPRLHFQAPAAVLFVRLYFLRTFFSRLQSRIEDYQKSTASKPERPSEAPPPEVRR